MTDEPVSLEVFGLKQDEPIRYRRGASGRWRPGYARGVNQDGSLRISDLKTGGLMNLLVDRAQVERSERGPKGGENWFRVERVV